MGLFGFLGKAIGGVAKTALGFIPGGNIAKGVLGVAGQLLSHKQPMSTTATKYGVATAYGVPTLRAQPRYPGLPRSTINRYGNPMIQTTPATLRASPVMPGGSVATSAGIMAPGGGLPPASYGGRSSGPKRKRKSASSRRSSKSRGTRKRSSGGRKLKFGSPAWRKKYMRKKRRAK